VSASAIYTGTVRHRRFAVRDHSFTTGLALAYVDLDELPSLLGGRLVSRRPGLVRFRREDYLGDPALPLDACVRDLVQERTGTRPGGPIRLLTHLRTFGHCFNPVSFYFCFDAAGEVLETVVGEVTNTPWGERHAYVIAREAGTTGPVVTGSSQKVMHVSPFMGMDHHYEWRVAPPGDTVSLHIESHREGGVAFDATLAMRGRPFTRAALARVTAGYPFATLRVLGLIYTHALRLKLKGVRVHPHPEATAT
jgi:DUF1365 family protein